MRHLSHSDESLFGQRLISGVVTFRYTDLEKGHNNPPCEQNSQNTVHLLSTWQLNMSSDCS